MVTNTSANHSGTILLDPQQYLEVGIRYQHNHRQHLNIIWLDTNIFVTDILFLFSFYLSSDILESHSKKGQLLEKISHTAISNRWYIFKKILQKYFLLKNHVLTVAALNVVFKPLILIIFVVLCLDSDEVLQHKCCVHCSKIYCKKVSSSHCSSGPLLLSAAQSEWDDGLDLPCSTSHAPDWCGSGGCWCYSYSTRDHYYWNWVVLLHTKKHRDLCQKRSFILALRWIFH